MIRRLVTTAVICVAAIMLAGSGLAASQTSRNSFVHLIFPPVVVAGQMTGYTVYIVNGEATTWKNVSLKMYLPHQTLVTRNSSATSSPLRAIYRKVSGSTVTWRVNQLPPQADIDISAYTKVAGSLTGKLCLGKVTLMIGGKAVVVKTMKCVPLRQN